MEEKLVIGLIVGNRNFFPDYFCKIGREKMIDILKKKKIEVISLSENETKFGAVETWQDAKKCAEIFKKNRDRIDGIIVTLPNFGDEKAIADTIRLSNLDVPVLIHAWPDEPDKMDVENRRDSFCGKISVCNNLIQYGIKFSLTSLHTVNPENEIFLKDIDNFIGVCRIIKGLKNVKFGAIGTRPDAFKTVRYSEKILEKYGISISTIDLSEIFTKTEKVSEKDPQLKNEISRIKEYTDTSSIPASSIIKMAKLKFVIEKWIKENDLSGIALQCWTSMEENYGIVPCGVMSFLSNSLIPSACEVDITGVLSMYILQLASGYPSAIVDWNNNYQGEENKVVIFHCSNLPTYFLKNHKMDFQEIIANNIGKENSYGAIFGRIKKSHLTFLRLTTDDFTGKIKGYTGEGESTDDKLDTFGGYGVVEIPKLQKIMRYICENGFEHHTIINLSSTSEIITESLRKYKGLEIESFVSPQ